MNVHQLNASDFPSNSKHNSFNHNHHTPKGQIASPPQSPSNRRQLQVQIEDSHHHAMSKQSSSRQRPQSAYPASSPSNNNLFRSQSDNRMGPSGPASNNRPKSATGSSPTANYHSPSHNAMHSLPPKEKEKHLGSLVRRIRQKSAKGTKETWSAARLSELLEGST
jgi:hypothetical protein